MSLKFCLFFSFVVHDNLYVFAAPQGIYFWIDSATILLMRTLLAVHAQHPWNLIWEPCFIYSVIVVLTFPSHVWLFVAPWTVTHQASLRDSPGKNTGLGCHFLLQCMKVKSEIEVAQSCPTLSDPMDCSPPGSSVHGIFQARGLEWDDTAFSDVLIWPF